RQGGLHAARPRRVIAPTDQRVKPNDSFAAPAQAAHFLTKFVRLAGVVAVGKDHHRGARIHDAPRMPSVERGKAITNAGSATDALRHQREFFYSARHVAVAERR